jgi:hypothetical protein
MVHLRRRDVQLIRSIERRLVAADNADDEQRLAILASVLDDEPQLLAARERLRRYWGFDASHRRRVARSRVVALRLRRCGPQESVLSRIRRRAPGVAQHAAFVIARGEAATARSALLIARCHQLMFGTP